MVLVVVPWNFPDFWSILWHIPDSWQIPWYFQVFQTRGDGSMLHFATVPHRRSVLKFQFRKKPSTLSDNTVNCRTADPRWSTSRFGSKASQLSGLAVTTDTLVDDVLPRAWAGCGFTFGKILSTWLWFKHSTCNRSHRVLKQLERCNPWPHVANRHISRS